MTRPARRAKTTAASNTGSFATMGLDESGVEISGPDWMNATEVEVDTELASLYGERYQLAIEHERHREYLISHTKRSIGRNSWDNRGVAREEVDAFVAGLDPSHPNSRSILREIERDAERIEAIRELDAEIEPLDDIYVARGRWPRAFLVTNAGGHVHSSMNCSTCFSPGFDGSGNLRRGTEFHWITEMSGKDQDEIIDAAGQRACSVCYPDAPVETRNKPTQLFSEDEKRKALERIEREKAKEEKARKTIEKGLTEDGSPFKVDVGGSYPEVFKTEQAATTWVVDKVMYDRAFEYYAMNDGVRNGVEQVKAAIATKHGWTSKELDEHLEKKIVAKAKREKIDLTTRVPRGY